MVEPSIVDNINEEFTRMIKAAKLANEASDMSYRLLIMSLIRRLNASRNFQPTIKTDITVKITQQLFEYVLVPYLDGRFGTTITDNIKKKKQERIEEVFRGFRINEETRKIILDLDFSDIVPFYNDCENLGNEAANLKWSTQVIEPLRYTPKVFQYKKKETRDRES